MLKITADFDLKALDKKLVEFIQEAENRLVEILKNAGKNAVDSSRSKAKTVAFTDSGFGNITWELRNSIGYVIVKDHQIIDTYFPPLPEGEKGRKEGIAYAEEVALLLDDGDIMLIVVAGKEYAYYVEAKGYDVISGSESHMEQELKKALKYSRN